MKACMPGIQRQFIADVRKVTTRDYNACDDVIIIANVSINEAGKHRTIEQAIKVAGPQREESTGQ